MTLSYDGSLLYHLAAHMPLHCIIIVVPPFVLLLHWLVIACCVASITGIFAARPSFG